MYPSDHHQTVGVWSVLEDRDLSRAAAERHFMMQALSGPPQAPARQTRLRRWLAQAVPSAVRTRGAEA